MEEKKCRGPREHFFFPSPEFLSMALFAVTEMYKIAASAAKFANCMFLHTYSVFTYSCCGSQLREHTKISYTSWHDGIFYIKLRTIEAENS